MKTFLKYFAVFFTVFFALGGYFGFKSNKYYETDEYLKEAVFKNLSYEQRSNDEASLFLSCSGMKYLEYNLKTSQIIRKQILESNEDRTTSRFAYVIKQNTNIATFLLGGGGGWTIKELVTKNLTFKNGDWRIRLGMLFGGVSGAAFGYWLVSSDPPSCSDSGIQDYFKKLIATNANTFNRDALLRYIGTYKLQHKQVATSRLLIQYGLDEFDQCMRKQFSKQLLNSLLIDSSQNTKPLSKNLSFQEYTTMFAHAKHSWDVLMDESPDAQKITFLDFIYINNFLEFILETLKKKECAIDENYFLSISN
ncbi:MAG: hypothetical protein K9H62_13900 [Bacteroidales bacterium]|nr:hypothetical protein [Bacteroidales bacterium]